MGGSLFLLSRVEYTKKMQPIRQIKVHKSAQHLCRTHTTHVGNHLKVLSPFLLSYLAVGVLGFI